ncbi:cell division protein SepF [Nitriliruptoraceae bacterium ZYF776]|nr:cell division protein SepF [Profundirhabdus halotolerans]
MSSGLWYRTLVYLGLKEEPEEGYDDLPERGTHDEPSSRDEALEHERFDPVDDPDARRPVRAVPPAPAGHADEDRVVRPLRSRDSSHVRSLAGSVRTAVVEIVDFEDVEAVGSRYRTGQPVLFDLRPSGEGVPRRVVDFVAGLTYASHGRLTKAGPKSFLLVPDGIELPGEERERLAGLGYRVAGGAEA